MNYVTIDNWHYVTNEGYYFKKEDVITNDLYLGSYDSINNWDIITETEKQGIEKGKEEEEKSELL